MTKNFVPLLVRCSTSVWRMTVPGFRPPGPLIMVALDMIGVRRATQLAPSAFLASTAGSSALISHILPDRFGGSVYPHVEQALFVWSESHDQSPPPPPVDKRQKAWDVPVVQESYDSPGNAPDARSRARLLVVATKESGAWLHVLPHSPMEVGSFSCMGLHMPRYLRCFLCPTFHK